jgi:2-polyprenyl-3-methyl-5-hydroxy-6-metoxy-1,4-benzoquinol methylase
MERIRNWVSGNSKSMSRQNIYKFLEAELGGFGRGANILNVGAGGEVGRIIAKFQLLNQFECTSIDVSEDRAPDLVEDICTYVPAKEYDCIIMIEILEHVLEPHAAINNIEKILKPGGKLILTSPFLYPIHDRPNDYFRFTKYGLAYLLRNFSQLKIIERTAWMESINIILVRLLRERTKFKSLRILLALFAIFSYPIACLLSKIIVTDFAPSGYLVVCRKSGK